MVVAGCPQCLMYVMLSEEEKQPKCPKCKSPVLLRFHKCGSTNKT
uniref:GIR1-like zinc ribbon domain-containing protein n=1 Tax=Arundo donax TaxID=35708 RepID=A0A0A8YDK1_ARUDO